MIVGTKCFQNPKRSDAGLMGKKEILNLGFVIGGLVTKKSKLMMAIL